MSFPSKRIRLHLNCNRQRFLDDEVTGEAPRFLKPSDLRIETALFDDDQDALRGAAILADLDQIACAVKIAGNNPRTGLAVMQKVVAIADVYTTLTLEEWQSGEADKAHAIFEFSHAETAVELDDDEQEFYLVIYGITADGREVPLANGIIIIEESGAFSDAPATVTADTFYTKEQSDSRYLLAADLSGKVDRSGDTMLGPLILDDDPATALGAATKQYVDARETSILAAVIAKAGGTMTGLLTLSGAPTANLHAATKLYVDTADALKLALAGGTMTGLLTLSGAPTANLHAATKLYADGKLSLAGGTLTGALTLSGAPTSNLHAATKLYVDTAIANLVNSAPGALDTLGEIAAALGNDASFSTTMTSALAGKLALAGGTMTGALVLSGAPTTGLHAATKTYVDTMLPLAGGTMTGLLTLSGAPTVNLHAATKLYVDTADALKLNLTGGTLSGALSFSGTGHAGMRVNNLTSAQVTALGGVANGAVIYDTTIEAFRFREANTWKTLSSGGGGTTWLQSSGAPDNGDGADGNYNLRDDGTIDFKDSGAWSVFVAARLPLAGGILSGTLEISSGDLILDSGNLNITGDATVDGVGYFSGNVQIASGNLLIGGDQILTTRQAAISDHILFGGYTGTNGGYGFASLAVFNAFIAQCDDLAGRVNSLLARLRASTGHGIISG